MNEDENKIDLSEKHSKYAPLTQDSKRLYNIWACMKQRCNNPNHTAARWYHDKGIRVCDEWNENFHSFAKWAKENGYFDGGSIDRIDASKGYNPENCRWITLDENRNRAKKGKKHERRTDAIYRERRKRGCTASIHNNAGTEKTEIDYKLDRTYDQARLILEQNLKKLVDSANNLLTEADENLLLSVTFGYLAGKEAGIKAAQAANKPDTE